MLKFNKYAMRQFLSHSYLNTSNVKVQPNLPNSFSFKTINLNTSNVKVQLIFHINLLNCFINLNTSNVKVQQKYQTFRSSEYQI